MNTIEQAQKAADNCSGVNAIKLVSLNADNVIERRKDFLLNVAYNGKRSHEDIIVVLQYMSQFCTE